MKKSIILLTLTLLSACAGRLHVDTPKDHRFDATRHHSYAWLTPPIMDETGREETIFRVDRLLRENVNQQLERKGYQHANKNSADFLVDYRYHQTLEVDQGGIVAPTQALEAAWETPDEINETAMDDYFVPVYVPMLHIELLLSGTDGTMLWEGKASKRLDAQDPNDEALQNILLPAVRKMLSYLPDAK